MVYTVSMGWLTTSSNNHIHWLKTHHLPFLETFLEWQHWGKSLRGVTQLWASSFRFHFLLSRQNASTADSPNKDCPCCLGQRRQQAKPEATAHQWDQTISSWGWASSFNLLLTLSYWLSTNRDLECFQVLRYIGVLITTYIQFVGGCASYHLW